jgi:hypothetical protein
LVDDNIRDIGGHYFELATLLLSGAEQLGYQPVLAINRRFDQPQAVRPNWQLHPTFRTRRLVRWSLGVDGRSRYQRDLAGRTVGAGMMRNLWTGVTDRLNAPAKQPQRMIRLWAENLCRLLTDLKPRPHDSLLVSTGDDFSLLALAAAIKQADIPPLRIDVIFHFALYDSDQADRSERVSRIGRQIRSALDALRQNDIHLHATTDSLAAQLREAKCGVPIHSIPYPTRHREVAEGSSSYPLKAILAGLPRAEKGRGAIADLLALAEESLLKNGRYQISMHMPARRWRAMIPRSLHDFYERALRGERPGPLEVMTSNLSTQAYHDWLDTADLGLFLYEPNRYVARCSGVLLEMLIRGIPVIVPDGCWMADQVRLAGGDRSIGFIYQDRSQIPELMRQFAEHRDQIRPRSIAYAATINRRHDGRNTLLEMGLNPVNEARRAA